MLFPFKFIVNALTTNQWCNRFIDGAVSCSNINEPGWEYMNLTGLYRYNLSPTTTLEQMRPLRIKL